MAFLLFYIVFLVIIFKQCLSTECHLTYLIHLALSADILGTQDPNTATNIWWVKAENALTPRTVLNKITWP